MYAMPKSLPEYVAGIKMPTRPDILDDVGWAKYADELERLLPVVAAIARKVGIEDAARYVRDTSSAEYMPFGISRYSDLVDMAFRELQESGLNFAGIEFIDDQEPK